MYTVKAFVDDKEYVLHDPEAEPVRWWRWVL